MKLGLFAAILVAGAVGGASFAQGAPAPAAAPTGAAAANAAADSTAASPARRGAYDPSVMICKWTEELGTMLGRHKTCMTRAQWDQLARDSEDELNDRDERSNNMGLPSK
jgi:hypothetical protein